MIFFRKPFAAAVLLSVCATSQGAITGMFDSTGAPLIDRLITGSGISATAISEVSYVGATAGGRAQAGLFDHLVIRGANATTLTLGPGIVLTSGFVTGLPTSNTSGSYSSQTDTGGNNYFRDFPAQVGTGRHGGRLDEKDENSLTFTLDVPDKVVGIKAHFVYASDEFPEWSGTQYADGFAFFVEGENYATLPDGRPVSLLRQEDNIHFLTNGLNGSLDGLDPDVADIEYDGLTRVLELEAPLRGGRENEITIVVADTGDQIYDSAVFLSGFELLYGDPITDTGVKLRHKSEDDVYVEFEHGVAVPEPGTIGVGVLMAGGLLVRRRRSK